MRHLTCVHKIYKKRLTEEKRKKELLHNTATKRERKKSEGACGRMSQNLESICVNGAMQSIHIYIELKMQ